VATVAEIDELEKTLLAGAADHAPTPALDSHLISERYQVLGMLGEGGMGTVYRVHDRELDEVVALKTLRHGWIDTPGALARFRREVKLARRVTHRGIARTFDIGDADGERFLTMEYIDGHSLARRLAESGPLAIDEVLWIAGEIAEALEAAHKARVIHRDLKPDNIMISSDDRVVITDFGIARTASGPADECDAGAHVVIGTPAYMAPEQVAALPVDHRTDLYALGLVIYEMLTGRRPFEGASAIAIASARLVTPAPDPRALRSSTPTGLAELIRELLAREPRERPATATAVVTALKSVAIDHEAGSSASSTRLHLGVARSFAHAPRSLALYPLRTAGAAEDSWIGDGLCDDLLDSLSMVKGLRVKARALPTEGESPQEYGRRLGVQLVLEGTVRRRGDDLRLILRLSTVRDGFQVWAHRYICPFGQLLMISDQAADAVAAAAGEVRAVAPRSSLDPVALELYLRARDLQARQPIAWRTPSQLLGRALELAPDDPSLLAAYAYNLATSEFDVGPEAAARATEARRAAERAISVAPHLAEPWVALARVDYLVCDTAAALADLRRALSNGPSVARAHDLAARILTELDRHEEAAQHLKIALSIDSNLTYAHVDQIRIDALAGRWDDALSQLAELDGERREFALLVGLRLCLWLRRNVLVGAPTGRNWIVDMTYELTREVIDTRELSPRFNEHLRGLLNNAPPVSRAMRLFRQIEAEFCLVAGDEARALEAVEASVRAGLEDLAWLRSCPLLDPLRAAGKLDAVLETVEARAMVAFRGWDQTR